jgi:pimeloyl-ACP methyl ester carboxylesterase
MNIAHAAQRARLRIIIPALAAAIAALVIALSQVASAQTTTRAAASGGPKPAIVLEHGAWANTASWAAVIQRLQADGYTVYAPPNPLQGLTYDSEFLADFLHSISGPIVLVGHSYGGAVITAAGTDDRVAGLVYIAALAPDETETPQGQQDKFPTTDVFGQIEVADGRIWMIPEGIESFAGDLSEEEKEIVWATAAPPAANLFNEKVPGAAWRTKPSAYIVAAQDHAVNPELERFSAERMGATTYEVESSHVPMLSHPDIVLDAIRNLATAVSGSLATA